jgi:DNA-binding NarL/FixJ family response regulator
VLSGSVTDRIASEARQAGAQDALPKSAVTPPALVRIILSALDREKAIQLRAFHESIARIDQRIEHIRQKWGHLL